MLEDSEIYRSPKRKRDGDSQHLPQPKIQTTGIRPKHPATRRASDAEPSDGDDMSPRQVVARKFQRLDLEHPGTSLSKPRQPTEQQNPDLVLATGNSPHPSKGTDLRDLAGNYAPRSDSSESNRVKSMKHDNSSDQDAGMFQFTAGQRGSNSTWSSTASTLRPSPSNTTSSDTSKSSMVSSSPNSSESSPPTAFRSDRINATSRSPPPLPSTSSELSSADSSPEAFRSQLWWQDSEITGHTPSDPDEDNYGVNGVGYQKTRSEAAAVAEKRRRQVELWRSREMKDARSRRADGRRALGRISGSGRSSPVAGVRAGEESSGNLPARRVVRFEDG